LRASYSKHRPASGFAQLHLVCGAVAAKTHSVFDLVINYEIQLLVGKTVVLRQKLINSVNDLLGLIDPKGQETSRVS
jgi:hypothetical protein